MPDEDYTAIGIIIDKSGSMSDKVEFVVDGFNEFLGEQKEVDGRATITTTFFDSAFPPEIEKGKDLQAMEELTEEDYNPGGRTALLDAVGYTIDEMGKRFDKMGEADKPSDVILCIITDGKENSSREYKREQIKDMIEEQEEEWGWDVIFIGAGIDAFSEAGDIGVDQMKTMSSKNTKGGYQRTYAAASKAARQKRVTGGVDASWKADLDEDDSDSSVSNNT